MTAARLGSAVVFVATVALLAIDRRAFGDGLGWFARGGLALIGTGALGAAVHAAGFASTSLSLRFVARPVYAWPAVIAGALIYLFVDDLVQT